MKRLLRAPARLYDWHLGWLLGRRFLRLTHVGRRSGRRYETVLEVVGENPRSGELIVVAGFGRSAGWYRNIQAGGAREVAVGMERFVPVHRLLEEPEAEAVLAAYERRNRLAVPVIRVVLSRLVGWRYDGSESARRALVRELPMVGLRPETASATGSIWPPTRSMPFPGLGLLDRTRGRPDRRGGHHQCVPPSRPDLGAGRPPADTTAAALTP